jgi:hypothetical protein
MKLTAIKTMARSKLVEIVVTLLVTGALGVAGFAARAWAEGNFVSQSQFATSELARQLDGIADEIRELDYRIRAATLDKQAADARGDTVGSQRAEADILYFTQEKDAKLREREELLKGGPTE